jgi:probable phosphoglycerate mutase
MASGESELEIGRKQVIDRQNMLARLYLIRHGETKWSLSSRHTSRTDIPLIARGEDGALELGQRLRDIQFARMLTTPRQRARRMTGSVGS